MATKLFKDYVYDPRDCKNCENYKDTYIIVNGELIRTIYPQCMMHQDIAQDNHKGCFNYIPNSNQNLHLDKINISIAFTNLANQVYLLNQKLENVKEKLDEYLSE